MQAIRKQPSPPAVTMVKDLRPGDYCICEVYGGNNLLSPKYREPKFFGF